jgi:outer membrane protein OmpA-like peptidoglycan-associated protein
MHTKLASVLMLSLGTADLAALDLVLAPRLVSRSAASAPAAQGRESMLPRIVSLPDSSEIDTVPARGAVWAASIRLDSPAAAALPARAAPDVEFARDSILIERVAALRDLGRVTRELLDDPDRRLLIRGHADPVGVPAYNLTLGRRRAEAVQRYLVKRGAPADRIAVEAVGATEPADPRPTPAGWARDRRVELVWR